MKEILIPRKGRPRRTLILETDNRPLNPIITTLKEKIEKNNVIITDDSQLANRTGMNKKTLTNITEGKHTPSIQQFKSLLELLELECFASTRNSEPTPFSLEHNAIINFINGTAETQGMTDTELEKAAKLKFRTLHQMRKSIKNYNLETVVRILQALGYFLVVNPKEQKEQTKPQPPITPPAHSFTGTPVDHTHDPNLPLIKGLKQ